MTASHLLLIAFLIGHAIHIVVLLNLAHGTGLNARWMDMMVFAVLGLVSLVVLTAAWPLWGKSWAAWPWLARGYVVLCLGTLLVGLPLVTIMRVLRRHPVGMTRTRSSVVDLAGLHGRENLLGPGKRSGLLRLPFNDAFRVHISEWSVTIENLPAALDGLSLLHLTDFHFAPTYNLRFFEEVVRAAIGDAPEPDLVLLTGDFVDHDDAIAWTVPVLSPLHARLGRFAILGNHDYRHDFRSLRRELRRAGFTTLEGRWAVLEVNGCRLAIGGTSYPWGKDLGQRAVPTADARILMSHAPDQIYRAASWGIDLMLCGHNHGGQVRLPVLGPILMPSRYSRRFDRGFFRVGPTLMFVGQGIGAKDPVRIGCMPEITRLVLKSRLASGNADDHAATDSVIGLARS